MRLGDFIAELSRYRPGVLRCAEEVADRRVSGTFPARRQRSGPGIDRAVTAPAH